MNKNLVRALAASVLLLVTVLVSQHLLHHSLSGRTLVVYTNSSFAAEWGAGPLLSHAFEEQCECHVKLVDVNEGGLILQRLSLERNKSSADVVLGLDQLQIQDARRMFRWQGLKAQGVQWSERFPQQLIFSEFLPIDWAPMTFVYKKHGADEHWPQTLDDLLQPQWAHQIALEDPRTSTGGLEFLFWVLGVKGEDAGFQFLERLKPSIQSVSPSWSSAYGLFKKDQAKMVFSYVTSPIYHWREEHDESYQALTFREGHPAQLEYVGVVSTCHQCQLAQKFVSFLLTPAAQKMLMEANFMLPVVAHVENGTLFEKLPTLTLVPIDKMTSLIDRKNELLRRWSRLGI